MKDKSYLTFLSVLVGIFPWNFEGGKAEDWEQGMNLELLCSQPVKGVGSGMGARNELGATL